MQLPNSLPTDSAAKTVRVRRQSSPKCLCLSSNSHSSWRYSRSGFALLRFIQSASYSVFRTDARHITLLPMSCQSRPVAQP
jgi:hypothetical protein